MEFSFQQVLAKSRFFKNKIITVFASRLLSFLDSVGVESRFHHLYKVNFDNMASYLQKKKERLEQQNQQGGKKRAARHSNGAAKKSKAENKEEAGSQKRSSES